MGVYAGLDISLDAVAICFIGETGEMVWQGKVLVARWSSVINSQAAEISVFSVVDQVSDFARL